MLTLMSCRAERSFPVARRLQRVDREHLIPRRHQRRHPRSAVRLDPGQHPELIVPGIARLRRDHGMQADHPFHALRQPRPGQDPPVLGHQRSNDAVLTPPCRQGATSRQRPASWPPAGLGSFARVHGSDRGSAHPPAATGTESLARRPVALIRLRLTGIKIPGLPGQITIISQDGGWRLLRLR
jgi:hypothetical protein